MGATSSKEDREETVDKDINKESHFDGNTIASYEDEEESMIGAEESSTHTGKKMHNLTTPRANHVRSGGFHAQSRVDRQLANAPSSEHRDDVGPPPSVIADDQVHVNLAMADLMAYLQVVANNSNNLPLTRRDDPELGRMVSSLTSEEYARKSAAFVPADVRVIGGSFSKYGRVWDLPTSAEYNASDGAQEPGKLPESHAGSRPECEQLTHTLIF